MKFTNSFMDTLKVFSRVNQNMFFRKGNIQTSVVTTNNGAMVFFVRAKTDVEIEQDFAVGELGKFVQALGLFSEPEITMTDTGSLLIDGEGKHVTFRLTNPEFIKYKKDPDKVQLSVGIETVITEAQIVDVHEMHGIFKAKYISFQGKDGDFLINVHSGEDVNFSNNGTIIIGKTDEVFTATIAADLFHLPDTDYKVVVSRKGWVYFGNDTYEYFIPVDANHSSLRG
jgi:hypothetical protein